MKLIGLNFNLSVNFGISYIKKNSQTKFRFTFGNRTLILPLAMLHHGNVMYVKKALRGTDCARLVSFQK